MIGTLFYWTGAAVWAAMTIGTAVFVVALVRTAIACAGFVARVWEKNAAWQRRGFWSCLWRGSFTGLLW